MTFISTISSIRRLIDPFTLIIMAAAVLASLMPPPPAVVDVMKPVTFIGVAVVFFLHGARLSPHDVVRGFSLPRLHIATVALTYLAFPLLALAMHPLMTATIGRSLADGFVFLAALPSTVQSSVSFVAIAGGHVAAAVAAAALSNLVGVFLTPLILSLTLAAPGGGTGGSDALAAVAHIAAIILAPFVAGQIVGRFLRPFLVRYRQLVGLVDRSVIALLVYQAIGQSVVGGLWRDVSPWALFGVAAFSLLLLLLVGLVSRVASRGLKLQRDDAIVLAYCGSKKSLASGMPMLRVLYGDQPAAGSLALPIIIFHQLQLIVFSMLATRAGRALAARKAALSNPSAASLPRDSG